MVRAGSPLNKQLDAFWRWSACFVVLTLARPAAADVPARGVAFRWSAPPGCPTAQDVWAKVEHLLSRRDHASPTALVVDAEVLVDASAVAPYRLRISIVDRQGVVHERRMETATCAQVAEASAVVIALASDTPAADSLPPDHPPSPLPPAPSPKPEGRPQPVRPVAWQLGALVGVDPGTLRTATPGLGIRFALVQGLNRFEADAIGWLPRPIALEGVSSTGVDVGLLAGGLRYCRTLLDAAVQLGPCAGLEAGALLASTFGVTPSSAKVGPWLAPEVGLLATVRASSRTMLSLELDGLALAARPKFVIQPHPFVFQPPSATGRVLLGIHVRF